MDAHASPHSQAIARNHTYPNLKHLSPDTIQREMKPSRYITWAHFPLFVLSVTTPLRIDDEDPYEKLSMFNILTTYTAPVITYDSELIEISVLLTP